MNRVTKRRIHWAKIPLISSPGVGDYNIEHDYILAFTRAEPDFQFQNRRSACGRDNRPVTSWVRHCVWSPSISSGGPGVTSLKSGNVGIASWDAWPPNPGGWLLAADIHVFPILSLDMSASDLLIDSGWYLRFLFGQHVCCCVGIVVSPPFLFYGAKDDVHIDTQRRLRRRRTHQFNTPAFLRKRGKLKVGLNDVICIHSE